MRSALAVALGCALVAGACGTNGAVEAPSGAAPPGAAAATLPEPAIPDGLRGFSGTLAGTVRQVGEVGFTLDTARVVNTWKKSTATDPESAVGKVLLVNAQWQKAPDGTWRPVPNHVKWLSTLRAGDAVQIEVRNDEGARLHILELNADQRRAVAGER